MFSLFLVHCKPPKRKTMAKIVKSPSQVTPFAGINFIDKMLERSGVLELIDNQLDKRGKNSGYSYSEC